MDTMYKTGKGKVSVTHAVLAILILMMAIVEPGMASKKFKHGYVMARSMVLDDNGQPILVEFDEQGNEIGELPIPSEYANRVDELEIVSANAIESQQERHETFLDNNPELSADARILPRDQVAGVTFPLADNQREIKIEESDLNPGTLSVLISGQSSRFLEDVQAVVLQEYPFDLTQSLGSIAGAKSVVLNRDGGIVVTSQYIVAPRVGFYGKDGEISDLGYGFKPGEDEVFGPVSGVQVYLNEFVYPQARAATDSDGSYHLTYYLMTCPPGGFEFNTDVWAKLNYTSFSPLGQDTLPYYLRAKSWDHCSAYIEPRTGRLIETYVGSYMARLNLYVDVMFLTGELTMENPDGTSVTVTDEETQYEVEGPDDTDEPKATEWYDFDNDGKADRSEIGRMVDLPDDDTSELVFEPDPEGDVQGVYFSSSDSAATGQPDEQTPPDVIRQIDEDREQRIGESTGLLSQINRDDLRNTDILVFRSATGELVLERQGLRDEEVHYGEVAVGSEGNAGYRLMMRGPMDSMHNVGGGGVNRRQSFQEWATEYQLTEPFRSRDAFHLQPGEWVDIVAINRTTGYTGKQRAQLKSAADSPARDMSIVVEPIVLRPPNLRIWAERDYNIDKGMTQGESRDGNIISAEGAGLQSDQQIVVYSEWLAHDGSALPEGLSAVDGAQYGLTGRLAKVAGADLLQATGFQGELAEFPIAPGRQTQVLQLNDNLANPEHFYIHVIGKAKNQEECTGGSCADFDYTGSDAGVPAPLDTRPRFITPILTPHYDEESHWLAYREYRRLLREGEDPANGDPVGVTDPTRPTPTHVWNHRPEYQFSRYSLEIDEINRVQIDPDTGDESSEDIFNTDTPVIGSSDNLVDILYSLIGPEFDRLSPIDGGQDLILALGEEETRIELGEDNTLRIDNLDHLAGLDPEDFLTMRLYLNQDAGNVLWEYAFSAIGIFPPIDTDGPIQISADHAAEAYFSAVLYGAQSPIDTQVFWNSTSNVSIPSGDQVQRAADGYYSTVVNLPTKSGERTYLSVSSASASAVGSQSVVFETVPGSPHNIEVTELSGKTALGGLGEITLGIKVQDQFGNDVADGTPVLVSAEGLEISGPSETLGGELALTVTGASKAGTQEVVIQSGSITNTVQVTVHDIDLAIETPSTINTGETVQASVTANSAYGNLDGLEVDVSLIRGSTGVQSVTLSGGQAQFPLYVGNIRGDGQAMAAVAGKMTVTPFEVVDGDGPYLLDTVLSADAGAPGTLDIDGSQFQYTNSTAVVVPGTPGEMVDVSLVDYLAPPMIPRLYYAMQTRPVGNRLTDKVYGVPATLDGDVTLSPLPFGKYRRAMRFEGESSLIVEQSDSGQVEQAGLTLNLLPDHVGADATPEPETLIELPRQGLSLELASGRLEWSLESGGNTTMLQSEPLAPGQFHKVGAHWIDNRLVLQVDDTTYKSDLLPDAVVDAESEIVIGNGYAGLISAVKVHDWSDAKFTTFEGGGLQASSQVRPDGNAVIRLSTNPAAFAAVQQRRQQLVADREGFSVFERAYASSACEPPSYDDVDAFGFEYGAVPAFFGTMAECDVVPQMHEAFVIITDENESKWRRAFATVELANRAATYAALKTVEFGAAFGPACADGVVTGSVDTLAKGTCDFVTSLLLVGDVRDFAFHSFWLYADSEDDEGNPRFDEAIYVFSGLGIATTLLEATGAGVAVDAAIAGCKTAAKLLRGSEFPLGLASHVKDVAWQHRSDPAELARSLQPLLPMMQVTALVFYYGEDMAEVVDILKTMERSQVEGWLKYVSALAADEFAAVVAKNDPGLLRDWLDRVLPVAYAAVKDPLDLVRFLDETGRLTPFLEALQVVVRTQEGVLRVSTRSYVGQAINATVDQLGKNFNRLGSDELASMGSDWRVFRGFVAAYDVGRGDTRLMEALTRFPCVPSKCDLGGIANRTDLDGPGKIAEFFGLIGEIPELVSAGRITDGAYDSLVEVLEQLGSVQAKNGQVNENLARGASEVIALAVDEAKKGRTITGFEVSERIISNRNGDIGQRIYDLVLEVDGKTLRIESKAWRPDQLSERLLASSLGGKIVDGEFKNKGPQLRKDLIDSIGKALNGNNGVPDLAAIDVQWRFDGRVTKSHISEAIEDIIEDLENSTTKKMAFFKELGEPSFYKDETLDEKKIAQFVSPENIDDPNSLRAILQVMLNPE